VSALFSAGEKAGRGGDFQKYATDMPIAQMPVRQHGDSDIGNNTIDASKLVICKHLQQ
jgi:hypothetical protein